MRIIKRLQNLWFFSLIVFGIGVLLELNNGELNPSTIFIFIMYCVLYFIASNQKDQKSKQYKDGAS